jgi:carbamoyl-phosphate synthase large subunit
LPLNVLVTGVGGTAGQSVINAIRLMKEPARIVGVDSNPFSAGLYLANKGYVIPPASDPNFITQLKQVCVKEDIKVLIPTVDEELIPISLSKTTFEEGGTTVLLASSDILEQSLDKWKTYMLLHEAKIPTIKSMLNPNRDLIVQNFGVPFVIKPRQGRGGRGFTVLENLSLFDYYVQKIDNPIFQEYLTGEEYTVDVVACRKGKILAIVTKKRVEMRGGSTYKAITVRNKEIEKITMNIALLLKANGPLNIQFIINPKTGQPNVLEINPRFSSTLSLTVHAGINSVELLIEDALGKTPNQTQSFKEGLCMLRYWQDVVVPSTKILGGVA